MALKISTGLVDKMMGMAAIRSIATYTASTIAAVDGGGGLADTLTDSDNGFVTAGFKAGDSIIVTGFTGGMQYISGPFTITTVVVGTITLPTATLTDDAAAEAVTIVALSAGSFRDIFKHGVLKIYSGVQPATADAAATGSLLLTITVASGAFTPGAVANGLCFDAPAAGIITKLSTQVWSGVGAGDGTAGWFRLSANGTDAGSISTTLPRLDGAIATSGAELNMSSTTVATGATTTIDAFTVTLPKA
jgi:hypothetical protein